MSKNLKFLLTSFVLVFLAVVFIASPLRTVFHQETFEWVAALQRGLFWSCLTTVGASLALLIKSNSSK